jgi:RNA polymerase sigma factor (sigma-70 family)
VISGLLTRNVTLLGRTSMDLVGAGDMLRPWDDGAEPPSIPSTVSWTVHERAWVAVLDRRFAERVAPWPEVAAALMSRSVRRAQWLGQHLAILENPRVDARLMLLFWHLADRWGTAMPHLRGGDFDDLARQSADDSLLAILGKLDSFRCDSRFTTCAYKFALLEAAVKLRRRAWQECEIVLEADHWSLLADQRSTPDEEAETSELMRAIGEAIEQRLTSHQREILVAITLDDVPIDVLAERLNTNRGALYKTLHDARRKLRACLSEQGLNVDPFRESQSP